MLLGFWLELLLKLVQRKLVFLLDLLKEHFVNDGGDIAASCGGDDIQHLASCLADAGVSGRWFLGCCHSLHCKPLFEIPQESCCLTYYLLTNCKKQDDNM